MQIHTLDMRITAAEALMQWDAACGDPHCTKAHKDALYTRWMRLRAQERTRLPAEPVTWIEGATGPERTLLGSAPNDPPENPNQQPMSFANTRQNKARKTPSKDEGRKPKNIPASAPPETQDEHIDVPYNEVIVEEGFNVRTDFGESLAGSILEHGIQSRLFGYRDKKGRPVLVEGHRRYLGVGELLDSGRITPGDPKATLPFTIRQRYEDPKTRAIAMMVFGTQGKSLTMSERARCCQRLHGMGLDNVEIARQVGSGKDGGITPTAVADCLDLLEIVAPIVLHAVDTGRCAATFALELARAVPDKAQQETLFTEAADKAGPDSRVTAKHLSVDIGKRKRTGVKIVPEVATCRVCQCTEADCSLCIRATGAPCTWTEPDLCSRCAALPMAGTTEDDSSDAEGRLWKHLTVAVPMPEGSKVVIILLIAFRGERWRYGYELKWPALFRPGVPANKQDGWKKELPNVHGPNADTQEKAELLAAQTVRGELEVKKFKPGKEAEQPAALAMLDTFIRERAEALGGEVHEPAAADVEGEESKDEGQTVQTAPPSTLDLRPSTSPDFDPLFKDLAKLIQFYLDAKGIATAPVITDRLAQLRYQVSRVPGLEAEVARLHGLQAEIEELTVKVAMWKESSNNKIAHQDELRAEVDRLNTALSTTDTVPRQEWENEHASNIALTAEVARLNGVLDEALQGSLPPDPTQASTPSIPSTADDESFAAILDQVIASIPSQDADPERLNDAVATLDQLRGKNAGPDNRHAWPWVPLEILRGRTGKPGQMQQSLIKWILGIIKTPSEL